MPGDSGLPGSLMFLVVVVFAAILAFYAFTFRVSPDELGVVMRFGKITQHEPPGLHFRMPYPIDEVRLPKVTRQNIAELSPLNYSDAALVGGIYTSMAFAAARRRPPLQCARHRIILDEVV